MAVPVPTHPQARPADATPSAGSPTVATAATAGEAAVQGNDADALAARLQALRARAHDPVEPARLRFIEALAARAPGQPEAVRALVEARLTALLVALDAAPASPAPTASDAAGATPAEAAASGWAARPELTALPQLTARLAAGVQARGEPAIPAAPGAGLAAWPEPRALADARARWARLNARWRLDQSLAAAPDQAGPLNSQHLVHRALRRMREISPAYLQCFIAHADALAALEAFQTAAPTAPVPRKSARGRKGA